MPLTSASRLGLASLGMIIDDCHITLALLKVSVLIHVSLICSGVASGTLVSPVLLPGCVPVSIPMGAGDPLVACCNVSGLFGGTNILRGHFHSLYQVFRGCLSTL